MWFYVGLNRSHLINSDEVAFLELRKDEETGKWKVVVHFSVDPIDKILSWTFSTEAKARSVHEELCARLTAPTIQEGPV